VETSFYKYAAPEYDRPLPPAAARLAVLYNLDCTDPDNHHVRCCPQCGALYRYDFSYEYHVNGSEDEERLSRLSTAQAADYCRAQARLLESLRREIDILESSAGSLGDTLDRGHPAPAEAEAAYRDMQSARAGAGEQRLRLQAQVEHLRQACPVILTAWAEAHRRVCRHFLSVLPPEGSDARTARYVAQTTLEAWQRLPLEGEAFISILTNWLEGYLELLDKEIAQPSA
jgi:hypothetical protein